MCQQNLINWPNNSKKKAKNLRYKIEEKNLNEKQNKIRFWKSEVINSGLVAAPLMPGLSGETPPDGAPTFPRWRNIIRKNWEIPSIYYVYFMPYVIYDPHFPW